MTEVLVSSTVLILALAALRLLLRGKIDPRLQYALWLLAALRLLLPVPLVSSPVSVMNAAADVPAAVQRLTAPEDRRAPQTAAEAAAAQPAAVAEPQAQTKPKNWLPVRTILKTVWLTGAAILAGVMLAQNLAFLRKLRRVRQPLACVESPIPVWLVPGLPSPCLAGLFRPEIYLTPEAAADPATLGFVLRHELAHFRAKDQLWSLVRLVCQCVYWFDPFVWLAAALARRDCELACDARVLRGLDGESRAAYGRALLGLVTAKPGGGQLLSGATTMQLGKKSLTERITLIAKKPKMAACTLVFVLLLCPCARGLHIYRRVCAAGAGTRDGTAGSAAAARAGAGAHGRHGSAAARRRRPGGQFPDGVPDARTTRRSSGIWRSTRRRWRTAGSTSASTKRASTTTARASRPNRATRCWPSTPNTASCSCV